MTLMVYVCKLDIKEGGIMIRKTDYALRILRTLSDGRLYSMKALCASECIPQPFAYKIVALLRNAGLVQSLPGSKGGCRLAGDLRDFTLLDLIRLIEEDEAINLCLREGHCCEWTQAQNEPCRIHGALEDVQRKINAVYASYTLHDLILGKTK